MCLIVFAWQAHPDYRLIVAANRDEYHGRAAREAHWWPDAPDILAGRDLQAGGTWLAAGRNGRFATVTNYRENQRPKAGLQSRGEIATGFVAGSDAPLAFVSAFDGSRYAGVNVLAADAESLCYVSNRDDAPRALPPGIYGLSNASLDTPWSKLVRARAALADLVDSNAVNATALFRLLGDRTPAPAGEIESGDLPFALARAISAPFIVSDDYGTRCSTVIEVDNDGMTRFRERRFAAGGETTGESAFAF